MFNIICHWGTKIKTIMKYRYMPIRMDGLICLKSNTVIILNSGEDVCQQEIPFIAGRNERWYNNFEDTVSYKMRHSFSTWSALLLIWPKELKTWVHIKIFTHMIISSFYHNSQVWELRYSFIGEWINRLGTSIQWNIFQW